MHKSYLNPRSSDDCGFNPPPPPTATSRGHPGDQDLSRGPGGR